MLEKLQVGSTLCNLFQTDFCTKCNNPAGIYLFKVNDGKTRTMCKLCSKLTIKTPERRLCNLWKRQKTTKVFWNFQGHRDVDLLFLLLTLNKFPRFKLPIKKSIAVLQCQGSKVKPTAVAKIVGIWWCEIAFLRYVYCST